MAIRADSYGSVAEVLAFTRHLLDGQSTFNSTTRPTLTEAEKFIDRASGALNTALSGGGFATPVTNSTAVLTLADWVVDRATIYTELTQRGTGFSGLEQSRIGDFLNLHAQAAEFVDSIALGLTYLGVTKTHAMHEGLTFTGFDKHSQRADPDNTNLEQPKFRRGLFDVPGTTAFETDEDDD